MGGFLGTHYDEFNWRKRIEAESVKRPLTEERRLAIFKQFAVDHTDGPRIVSDTGFVYTTNPGNITTSTLSYWLTALNQWEQGHNPYPGALSEQPAKAIDILQLLQHEKFQYQQHVRKQQEASKK